MAPQREATSSYQGERRHPPPYVTSAFISQFVQILGGKRAFREPDIRLDWEDRRLQIRGPVRKLLRVLIKPMRTLQWESVQESLRAETRQGEPAEEEAGGKVHSHLITSTHTHLPGQELLPGEDEPRKGTRCKLFSPPHSPRTEQDGTEVAGLWPMCLTHIRGRPGRLAPSSIGVLGLGTQSTGVKSRVRIGPKREGWERESG